jgi:hypothetical protein
MNLLNNFITRESVIFELRLYLADSNLGSAIALKKIFGDPSDTDKFLVGLINKKVK